MQHRNMHMGWKQLHVLIYAAYFSLILHIYLGPIGKTNNPVKYVFAVLIAFVILSHVAGWIKRAIEDNKIYARIRRINRTITENGRIYTGVAKTDEFEEGKGQKFYINRQPVAVFKYKDNFYAISNTCAHQKGPLCQGRIVNGYVQCPWHQWDYSLKDGQAPKGFHDAVPSYDLRIKEGIIFISTKPHS